MVEEIRKPITTNCDLTITSLKYAMNQWLEYFGNFPKSFSVIVSIESILDAIHIDRYYRKLNHWDKIKTFFSTGNMFPEIFFYIDREYPKDSWSIRGVKNGKILSIYSEGA